VSNGATAPSAACSAVADLALAVRHFNLGAAPVLALSSRVLFFADYNFGRGGWVEVGHQPVAAQTDAHNNAIAPTREPWLLIVVYRAGVGVVVSSGGEGRDAQAEPDGVDAAGGGEVHH
jgi:hypothetical protein